MLSFTTRSGAPRPHSHLLLSLDAHVVRGDLRQHAGGLELGAGSRPREALLPIGAPEEAFSVAHHLLLLSFERPLRLGSPLPLRQVVHFS